MGNEGLIRRIDESRVVSDLAVLGESIIRPMLTESRRVAIGKKGDQVRQTADGKGTWRPPVKLDYFCVTLVEQDEKGDFIVDWKYHRDAIQEEKPRRLPIMLLFDRIQLNAMTYLGLYTGRQPWCKGNGKMASRMLDAKGKPGERKEVECPCEYLSQGKCKPHLRFQFHLLNKALKPAMGLGEVAVFRSTGKNTISAILGSLAILKERVAVIIGEPFDRAPIAGIPLVMNYLKKTVTDREGKVRTIPVVNVVCELSEEEIKKIVYERQKFYHNTAQDLRALLEKRQAIEIDKERDLQRLILQPETPREAAAIAEEFHPDQVDQKPPEEGPRAVKKDADEMKKLEEASKRAMPLHVAEALEAAGDEPADEPEAPSAKPASEKDKDKQEWL